MGCSPSSTTDTFGGPPLYSSDAHRNSLRKNQTATQRSNKSIEQNYISKNHSNTSSRKSETNSTCDRNGSTLVHLPYAENNVEIDGDKLSQTQIKEKEEKKKQKTKEEKSEIQRLERERKRKEGQIHAIDIEFQTNINKLYAKRYKGEVPSSEIIRLHQGLANDTDKHKKYIQLKPLNSERGPIKKLHEVKQEKSRLLYRLSEMASARLRVNNPDIADLSDPNRATKLGEQLSELYDNEWTDAFEEIANLKVNDEKIVQFLLCVLKYCYDSCRGRANKHRELMFQAFCMTGKEDFKNCGPDLRLRLKELQKAITNKSLQTIQESINKEMLNEKNTAEPWTCLTSQGKAIPSLKKKMTSPRFHAYTNTCISVCWYMQIQDPPLVLLFDPGKDPTTQFRAYTSSGNKLKFVLWPAMLLQENGAMISKGVAQYEKDEDQHTQQFPESGPVRTGESNSNHQAKNEDTKKDKKKRQFIETESGAMGEGSSRPKAKNEEKMDF